MVLAFSRYERPNWSTASLVRYNAARRTPSGPGPRAVGSKPISTSDFNSLSVVVDSCPNPSFSSTRPSTSSGNSRYSDMHPWSHAARNGAWKWQPVQSRVRADRHSTPGVCAKTVGRVGPRTRRPWSAAAAGHALLHGLLADRDAAVAGE